jgi:hypothetical protein
MSKVVYLRPPIVVKELASKLEVSPYRLMHDLCMNVLVRIEQTHRDRSGEVYLWFTTGTNWLPGNERPRRETPRFLGGYT